MLRASKEYKIITRKHLKTLIFFNKIEKNISYSRFVLTDAVMRWENVGNFRNKKRSVKRFMSKMPDLDLNWCLGILLVLLNGLPSIIRNLLQT